MTEWVTPEMFGEDSADDTARLQAMLDSPCPFRLAEKTYTVTAPIRLRQSYKVGRGTLGKSIIKNAGAGKALVIEPVGIENPVGIDLEGLTIDGQGTGEGLHIRGIAQSRFARIETKHSIAAGILAEYAVDCLFDRCVATDNATDGFLISDGTKAGVEFRSNANILEGCIGLRNVGAGVNVRRSHGNHIHGGDYSTNAVGVLMEGGGRGSVASVWIENNGCGARTIPSVSPAGTHYTADHNELSGNEFASNGIDITSGDGNAVLLNYITGDVSVAAAATNTLFGRQKYFAGTFTDAGSGTIDEHDPRSTYTKISGLKRLTQSVGSTVDIASDIAAFRLAGMKGLSSTSVHANNFAGYVDLTDAATAGTVTFPTAETDAAYKVLMTIMVLAGTPPVGALTPYMTGRSTTGFTARVPVAPGTGASVRVHWLLVR